MQHGYGGGQVRCWGFWNPRQHSTHMVKHDLPSMWLEESSALDGGERGTTIDPGATHIFTYFTRYLKAHFQTQLKSKIYVTTVNSYSIQKEDNCLFHDDIPLTTPSRRGSNDVRTCTLGDRGNIAVMAMDFSMMMLWWMMMRWKVTTMMTAMIRRIPA